MKKLVLLAATFAAAVLVTSSAQAQCYNCMLPANGGSLVTNVSINPPQGVYVNQNNSNVNYVPDAGASDVTVYVFPTSANLSKAGTVPGEAYLKYPVGSCINSEQTVTLASFVTDPPYTFTKGDFGPKINTQTVSAFSTAANGVYFLKPGTYMLVLASTVNGVTSYKTVNYTVDYNAKNNNTPHGIPNGGGQTGGGNTTLPGIGNGTSNGGVNPPGVTNNNTVTGTGAVTINPPNGIYDNKTPFAMTVKADPKATMSAVYLFPQGGSIYNACAIYPSSTSFNLQSGVVMNPPYSFSAANACTSNTPAADGKYYLKTGTYELGVVSLVNGYITEMDGSFTVNYNATNGGGTTGGPNTTLPGLNGGGNVIGGTNTGDVTNNNTINGKTGTVTGTGTVTINPPVGIYDNKTPFTMNLKADPNALMSAAYIFPKGGSINNACVVYPNGSNMNGTTLNLINGSVVNPPYSFSAANACTSNTPAADGRYYLNVGTYDLAVVSLVNGYVTESDGEFTVNYNAVTTGIQNAQNAGPKIFMGSDGILRVQNCPVGSKVCTYTAAGSQVSVDQIKSAADEFNKTALPKGIYIIKNGNLSTKVVKQ